MKVRLLSLKDVDPGPGQSDSEPPALSVRQPFINWRALSITVLWLMLCSLLWEATLASPFGWWHYRYEWMMGLHIKAWADLPVVAVMLWIAVAYTTVIVFETITVVLHIDKRLPGVVRPPRAGRAVGHSRMNLTFECHGECL